MTARALKLAASPAPPCVAYTRVSTEEQATPDKPSLAQQRDAVIALSQRLKVTVAEVFEDAGKSGGTFEKRPAWQRLVSYCESHPQPTSRAGYVLIDRDDRIGRTDDPEEATYQRIRLKRLGWIVRYAQNDSGDSPARPIERAMYQWQATAYRQTIKAQSKRGSHGAAARGRYPTRAPLGYRKGPDGKLVLGPSAERRMVGYMFERYDTGEVSLGTLCAELKAKWPGLANWSRPVVRQMLRNPAFYGDVVWHDGRGGPVQTHVPNAHPALVKRVLWDRVQARLTRNRKETRPTAGGYPLRELITCAECGAPYMGAGGPKGPTGDEDRYRFYREKPGATRCGHRQGTLQKRVIEPLVIAEIAKFVAQPTTQRAIAAALDRLLGAVPDTRQALEKERADLEAQRKRIVQKIAQGLLSDTEAAEALADIRAGLAALDHRRDQGKLNADQRKRLAADRERLLGMAKDFAARARKLSGTALRELLRPWLVGTTFDKKARTVTVTIRQVPTYRLDNSGGQGSPLLASTGTCSPCLPGRRRPARDLPSPRPTEGRP